MVMKTFEYMYRDKEGRQRKGVFQAEGRLSVVLALKKEGVVPLAVSERGAVARKPLPFWEYAFAVGIIAVCCTAFVLLQKKRPAGNQMGGRLETQEKTVAAKEVRSSLPEHEHPGGDQADMQPDMGVRKAVAVPGSADVSGKDSNTGSGEVTAQVEEARMPAHYSSQTESILSMLINVTRGNYPPPVPHFPAHEDIWQILERDIVVYDDDSEKLLAYKENVARVKSSLKEYLQAGGTTKDFVQYYHEELLKDHNDYRAAQAEMMRLFRARDDKALGTFMAEQNDAFRERGVRLLVLPPER